MALGDLMVVFSLLFVCLVVDGREIVVDIKNDLPIKTGTLLQVRCGEGFSNLPPGNHLKQSVSADKNLSCTATWMQLFNSWDAFLAKTDQSHNTVFWSIRKDGFYRSFDGKDFKFVERWGTE
ncbi:hypothetical protein VNO77_25588 [Canavalia gladiata]|uniref:S-protein homolog n=1 Tax=Canavalia gladiata TaxID=3824 RepID=A0AAN9L8F2_CANGL